MKILYLFFAAATALTAPTSSPPILSSRSITSGKENGRDIEARDKMSELPAMDSNFAVEVMTVDAHERVLYTANNDITAGKILVSPAHARPISDTSFDLASTTTTIPQAHDNSNNDIHIAASTVTLQPAIIATALPSSPQKTTLILPFKIQLWEYCTATNLHLAGGMYSNGNLRTSLDLSPGLMNSVKHFIPSYPDLEVGPFDFEKGSLRFGYNGSEWWDFETWRREGECRAGLWSGEAVECGGGAVVVRVREMECSVLLGVEMGVGE